MITGLCMKNFITKNNYKVPLNFSLIDWQETIDIRHKVLWPDKPPQFCYIDEDPDAMHFAIKVNNKLVCVASIYITENKARLRKFATLPEYQGMGVGSFLLSGIVEYLKAINIIYLWLDARESAVSFYQRLDFSCFGERFYKSGVSYRKMHKQLIL